jgi:hypothetical protein
MSAKPFSTVSTHSDISGGSFAGVHNDHRSAQRRVCRPPLVQNAKDNDVLDDVAGCGGSALTSKLLEITIALASPLINSAYCENKSGRHKPD